MAVSSEVHINIMAANINAMLLEDTILQNYINGTHL